MRYLYGLVRRIAGMFHTDRHDRQLAEEIESNLQMHIADNLRAGMSAGEARRQALLKLGGLEATKEAYRDQRGLPVFDTLVQDIRYGLRALRRNPGFALTAVLTLAMGIGATTAIFSAVYALLIRPLPYRDPGRLVWVAERGAVAEPDMIAWRERGRPFEDVAGYGAVEYTLTGAGEAARIPGAMVSDNFLTLLGVAPQVGRDFIPARPKGESRPASPAVALISDALWRERFSANPRVVGTALDLDGQAYIVTGVLPPRFRFPDMAYVPQVLVALREAGSSAFNPAEPIAFLQVLARLRARESPETARADLQSFHQTRLHVYPAPLLREAAQWKLEVTPLQRHIAGDSRTPLLVLLAAVGFVLLIACTNIANLQLVRAAARRHEIAVRGALGAGRTRLARQFLTESMLISALAAAGGLAIGSLAIDAIRGWQSPVLPWLASVDLDPFVFGFIMGLALLAAVLFGAAPAITGSRANPIDALKVQSPGLFGARDHRQMRNAFVGGELALALMLLIAAGLLVRSFRGLINTDPGYHPRDVLTAQVQLPLPQSTGAAAAPNGHDLIRAFASEVLPKLQALPGVRYAALGNRLPLQPNHGLLTLVWFGPVPPPRAMWANLRVPLVSVTPDFFHAMGISVVAGRPFLPGDNQGSPGVAIVNRAFARQFGPDAALGKRFHSLAPEDCATCAPGKPVELEIVGVTADVHEHGLDRPVEPEVYVPFAQQPQDGFDIVLAADGNPGVLAAPVRSTVFALDHQVPLYDVATLEERLSESLAQRRLTTFLLSAFAAVALMLAAIGVYGVISYAVAQRTQEIGIRVALGATRESVIRLILEQLARITLLGSAAGLALAAALSGVVSGLLYGVKPLDFIAFAVSWMVLTAVALLAGAAPVLRATRTDPCVALRYE